MSNLNWGHFPQLAESLRLHPSEVPLAWLNRLGRSGSLWQNVARDPANGFWPPSMPGYLPAERPVLPWWMRWIGRRPLAPVSIDGRKLVPVIVSCHAWLATENMRFLASWLAPDLRVCPSWLGQTSDRALLWSLIAFAADCHGPAVIHERSALLEKATLDEHAAPGDFLVLHGHVKRLAKLWLEQAGIAVPDRPARIRAGGLRTRTFPLALTALPSAHKAVLLSMSSYSPLTRLAYLDLISGPLHPSVFASLNRVLPAYSQDSAPWLALLANTLLGAVLGTPPDILAWRQADELRQLEEEFSDRGSFRKGFSLPGLGLQLRKQRIHSERAKARAHDFLLTRLETWASIKSASTTQELQELVLDRLARLAAVRATPAMCDEWREIRQFRSMADAKVELFQSGSAYYTELGNLLLAASLDEVRELLSVPEKTRFGELLDSLLNLKEPIEVTKAPARFWNYSEGVRLPFRPINHRGPHPAAIFSDLLVKLLKILSPPQVVVEELDVA